MADSLPGRKIPWLRRFFRSILSFRETPHRIGLAFGLGLALGILPGTGATIAAGVAALFRLNLPLAIAGALFVNPFTMPLFYGASYFLGKRLLDLPPPVNKVPRIVAATACGAVILAVIGGLLGYAAVRFWASRVQKRRARRRVVSP